MNESIKQWMIHNYVFFSTFTAEKGNGTSYVSYLNKYGWMLIV